MEYFNSPLDGRSHSARRHEQVVVQELVRRWDALGHGIGPVEKEARFAALAVDGGVERAINRVVFDERDECLRELHGHHAIPYVMVELRARQHRAVQAGRAADEFEACVVVRVSALVERQENLVDEVRSSRQASDSCLVFSGAQHSAESQKTRCQVEEV